MLLAVVAAAGVVCKPDPSPKILSREGLIACDRIADANCKLPYAALQLQGQQFLRLDGEFHRQFGQHLAGIAVDAVSYTHLTLPTT